MRTLLFATIVLGMANVSQAQWYAPFRAPARIQVQPIRPPQYRDFGAEQLERENRQYRARLENNYLREMDRRNDWSYKSQNQLRGPLGHAINQTNQAFGDYSRQAQQAAAARRNRSYGFQGHNAQSWGPWGR